MRKKNYCLEEYVAEVQAQLLDTKKTGEKSELNLFIKKGVSYETPF